MNTFKWILALVVSFTAAEAVAKPKTLLKIATLAPESSNWVKSLRNIDREVREATDDRVGLKIYPGGVQGDEKVVLRKIRIGQLHGGGFGGQGISQIFPDLLALEMPFLFNDYGEIEHVLGAMDDFYRQGYAKVVMPFWVGPISALSTSSRNSPSAPSKTFAARRFGNLPMNRSPQCSFVSTGSNRCH